MSTVVGYVVLTKTDGGWQPDWDGVLYLDRDEAAQEAAHAARSCGAENVMLGNVEATFVGGPDA